MKAFVSVIALVTFGIVALPAQAYDLQDVASGYLSCGKFVQLDGPCSDAKWNNPVANNPTRVRGVLYRAPATGGALYRARRRQLIREGTRGELYRARRRQVIRRGTIR